MYLCCVINFCCAGHLLQPGAAGMFVPGCPQTGVSTGVVPPTLRGASSASLQVHRAPSDADLSSPMVRALSFNSPVATDAQPPETPKATFQEVFPDAVFTVDYSASWPLLLEMVSKNFHPKEHHVVDNFGRAYKFVNARGHLDDVPSPSSFPLRITKGFFPVTPEKSPRATPVHSAAKVVQVESSHLQRHESSQTVLEVSPTQALADGCGVPQPVPHTPVPSPPACQDTPVVSPPKEPAPEEPAPVAPIATPVVTPPNVPLAPVTSPDVGASQAVGLTPEVAPGQATPVVSSEAVATPTPPTPLSGGDTPAAQALVPAADPKHAAQTAAKDTPAKKPNMYEDGSYWKMLVVCCVLVFPSQDEARLGCDSEGQEHGQPRDLQAVWHTWWTSPGCNSPVPNALR